MSRSALVHRAFVACPCEVGGRECGYALPVFAKNGPGRFRSQITCPGCGQEVEISTFVEMRPVVVAGEGRPAGQRQEEAGR